MYMYKSMYYLGTMYSCIDSRVEEGSTNSRRSQGGGVGGSVVGGTGVKEGMKTINDHNI